MVRGDARESYRFEIEFLQSNFSKMKANPEGLGAHTEANKKAMSGLRTMSSDVRPAMPPAPATRRTQPRQGAESMKSTHKNVSDRKTNNSGDFGMRYRPHLDKYFLKPERQTPAKRSLEEEWEDEVRKCSHPRWRRTIFLGDTYFTCEKCGNHLRQAVEPNNFIMSRDEAVNWFEDC